MRIVAVRATPVNIPFHAPYRFSLGSTASVTKTIVEVETDEGVSGAGECADGDRSAEVMRLGERLVGLDPLDLNECERRCVPAFEHSLWENVTTLRRAFGAIEMALWDVRGRAEGKAAARPARRRGAPRDRVHGVLRAAPSGPVPPGRVDAARDRALLRAHDRGVRRTRVRGQARDRRVRRRARDGARGARGDRRPATAPRRESRMDRANRARGAAPARALRHPLHRGARLLARGARPPAAVHGHRVLGARARPAACRRARRARLLRTQHRRARRHPAHARVRARVRHVRHRLLVPLRRHRHRERRVPAPLRRARADPRAQPGALPLVRRRRHRGRPVLPARRRAPRSRRPRPRRHARSRRARALSRTLPRRGSVPVGRGGRARAHAGLVRRAPAR